MKKNPTRIVLAGEGGQGIQTIAKVIASSASKTGYEVTYLPSFGVEQRGTPSVAYLIISRHKILYPRFETADYAVVLSKRAVQTLEKNIGNHTAVVFNSSIINEKSFKIGKLLGLAATELASTVSPRSFNVLIAAKICQILSLDKITSWKSVLEILEHKLKSKEIVNNNQKVFDLGWETDLENKIFSKQTFKPVNGISEHKNKKRIAKVFNERCKGCGLCVEICPVRAIRFGSKIGIYGNFLPEIDIEKCIGCGKCFEICPDVAIKVSNLK